MEVITAFEKKEIKEILLKLQSEVTQSILEAKKSAKPVELDQQSIGRVSRIDAIQQQQMSLASLGRLEQRLSQIKAALIRLNSDDFGICTKCEEPISNARLKARPESPLCLICTKKS